MQINSATQQHTHDLSDDSAREVRASQTVPKPAPVRVARASGAQSSSRAPDLGPTQTFTLFGTDAASPPNSSDAMPQREQRLEDYAGRVKAQMANIESGGSEAEKNVKFLNARPFMTAAGYFSGGLLAAGFDPDQQIKGRLSSYVGMGRPESKTGDDSRTYAAWQVAAGMLAHDRPEPGGTVNFQSMHLDHADEARVKDLESLGSKLQSHWTEDVAEPMQDPLGSLAARSGKADAYSLRATLQNLRADQDAFKQLGAEGQQAIARTLDQSGQVIIPNIYGYPLAGHAFVPYQPYDGNYENRPNEGLMVDLKRGSVSEIKGDQDFARWAGRNRDHLLQRFNESDRQGGLDAHWPKAGDVLDRLIAGENTTYPGYKNLVADQRIPADALFNYTRARGDDYQLKYGNLTAGADGIASQYQSVNQKNAAWENQANVFGSSEQNWKTAKGIWANTFGYVPVVGNLGNVVFGAHDGVNGMTAKDRIGGNVAATVSSLQLMHDLAPGAAELALGKSSPALKAAAAQASAWKHDPQTKEFQFQPALPERSAAGPDPGQGARLTADNVRKLLPELTAEGQKNAVNFLNDHGQKQTPPLNTPQDVANATRFFNDGGQLGLKGGAGDDIPPPGPRVRGERIGEEGKRTIADYIRQHPEKTDREIGRDLNRSSTAINGIRHSFGLQKTSGAGVFLTPARRAEIADYLRQHQGEPAAEIAGRFNVAATTIDVIRRRIGLPKTPGTENHRLSPAQKADIVDYIREHPKDTNFAIARHFNVSESTIGRIRVASGQPKAAGSGVPLNEAWRSEIADYLRRHPGQTTPEIAEHFGVSGMTVNRIQRMLDRLGPHGTLAGPGPSALPEGLDLHAPMTPRHQAQLDRIQTELAEGAPQSKRPRIDVPGTSAPTSQAGQPEVAEAVVMGPPKRGGAARLDDRKKDEIIEYIRQNWTKTDAEIGRHFNVPGSTINGIRHAVGLRKTFGGGVRLTSAQRIEIANYALAHRDESAPEIGRRFNVSDSAVKRIRQALDRGTFWASVSNPAALPEGLDLHAPVTPGHQQQLDQIQADLAGPSQTGPSEAGPSQARPSEAGPSQPRPADSPDDNEAVVQWMLDTYSDAELERVNSLPDDEFRREVETVKQRLLDQAPPP